LENAALKEPIFALNANNEILLLLRDQAHLMMWAGRLA
jgi:hypothetical protein